MQIVQVPKLLYRDGMRCLPTSSSGSGQGFRERWLENNLNIFSSANIHMSIFPETGQSSQHQVLHSGKMGFTRLLNLSPAEVEYTAKANALERLLFSISHQEYMDESIQEFINEADDARLRAVSRLLICPIYSKLMNLRQKLATGLPGLPFEALVTSFEDRFLDNRALLRTTNTYIPAVRAPVVSLLELTSVGSFWFFRCVSVIMFVDESISSCHLFFHSQLGFISSTYFSYTILLFV